MSASRSPPNRNNSQSFPALSNSAASLHQHHFSNPSINPDADPTATVFALDQQNQSSFPPVNPYPEFAFPFDQIADDDQFMSLDSQSINAFAPAGAAHPSAPAPVPVTAASASGGQASATSASHGAGAPVNDRTNVQNQAFDGSDDESQDGGNQPGGNSLEDNMSDDFGLSIKATTNGPDSGPKNKNNKNAPTPAWSELKTKAGKERKRLPLACIACRRKKIRCSGEKPGCKHCLRSHVPCVYKVTTRKAAPRTDYMAMLDKRLKRMEDRIIKIVPKSEQDSGAANVTRATVKPALPGSLPPNKAVASKKRGADEAFGAGLEHWARAEPKVTIEDPNKPTSMRAQEDEDGKLLQEGHDALPPRELQEHLADTFFDFVYGQVYHLLHKPSYMRKLKAGTLPPVLVLSVCALSARFSSHPYFSTTPNFLRGEQWAAPAREIVAKRYEWPNITVLTCLLLLGLHEFGTCQGGRSWYFGGQAIRMAVALQLHQDLEHDPQRPKPSTQLSFVDREIRRRTMWACFMMDRFSSSAVDRPIFVREEWLKIQLPIKEKLFRLDMPGPTEDLEGRVPHPVPHNVGQLSNVQNNMGVAAYMIRSIALWGKIINYLNQGGKDTDPHPLWSDESEYSRLLKRAEDFINELPGSLKYTAENLHLHSTEKLANQFLFLHISIQQNILFMNRFAVSSPAGLSQSNVPKEFVTRAGAGAFAAANRISELLKDAETHFVAAPFVGYCAFLSSTVHIFGMFSGNAAVEGVAKKHLQTNVKFISKMKRYWGMFHFMSENLREQYKACADAAMRGAPPHENSAESPVFQYGDWFARYPHGVSQSDFLDPASTKKNDTGDDAVLEQKPQLRTVEEFFEQLSPGQHHTDKQEAASRSGRPSMGPKRKSTTGGKRNGAAAARNEQQQQKQQQHQKQQQQHSLDPIVTNFSAVEQIQQRLQQQQQQQQQQQHQKQREGYINHFEPHANTQSQFSPRHGVPNMNMVNNRGNNNRNTAVTGRGGTALYTNLSPVSPGSTAGRGGYSAQEPHGSSLPYDNNDLIALSLSNNAAGVMPEMDRQFVFDAYHGVLDPAALGGGGQEMSHIDWDAALRSAGQNGGAASNPTPGTGPGATIMPDASSAWFMPFNVEPPKMGQDMGGSGGAGLAGPAQGRNTGPGGGGSVGGAGGIDVFANHMFSPVDGNGGGFP